MNDLFVMTGPALISFNGGSTRTYMNGRVLRAHCSTLPDYVHACFANSGLERYGFEQNRLCPYPRDIQWGIPGSYHNIYHWIFSKDALEETTPRAAICRCIYATTLLQINQSQHISQLLVEVRVKPSIWGASHPPASSVSVEGVTAPSLLVGAGPAISRPSTFPIDD